MTLLISLSGCASQSKRKEEKLANVYLSSGTSSLHRGNYSLAISSLKKSLQIRKDQKEAWSNLGIAYFKKSREKEAEQCFLKAIELDKDFHDAKFNLGLLYYKTKKLDKAEKAFRAMIRIPEFPRNQESYYYLGQIFSWKGENAKAHLAFEKSVEENKNFCPAWIKLGESYLKRNNIEKSKEAFENSANGLCYHFTEGQYEYASVLVKMKRFKEARKRLELVIRKAPDSEWATKAKSKLSLLSGDF